MRWPLDELLPLGEPLAALEADARPEVRADLALRYLSRAAVRAGQPVWASLRLAS